MQLQNNQYLIAITRQACYGSFVQQLALLEEVYWRPQTLETNFPISYQSKPIKVKRN